MTLIKIHPNYPSCILFDTHKRKLLCEIIPSDNCMHVICRDTVLSKKKNSQLLKDTILQFHCLDKIFLPSSSSYIAQSATSDDKLIVLRRL